MALRPRWAAPNEIIPYTPASLAFLSPPGSSGHHGTFKNVVIPHQLGETMATVVRVRRGRW